MAAQVCRSSSAKYMASAEAGERTFKDISLHDRELVAPNAEAQRGERGEVRDGLRGMAISQSSAKGNSEFAPFRRRRKADSIFASFFAPPRVTLFESIGEVPCILSTRAICISARNILVARIEFHQSTFP